MKAGGKSNRLRSLNVRARAPNNLVLETLDFESKKLDPLRKELATSTNLAGAAYLPPSIKNAVKKRHKSINTNLFLNQKPRLSLKYEKKINFNANLETSF